MRILHINDLEDLAGGREIYLSHLVQGLRAAGHQVDLVCETSLLKHSGRFRALLFEKKPDLIHLHSLEMPPALRAMTGTLPIVKTIYAYGETCPSGDYFLRFGQEACTRAFGSYCWLSPYADGCNSQRPWTVFKTFRRTQQALEETRRINLLLAISHYVKDRLIQNKIDPKRIEVLPLAIPETPVESGINGEIYLLFLGRLYPQKGLHWLLQALAEAGIRIPLFVLGQGSPSYVEGLKKEYGRRLPGLIRWMGWKSPAQTRTYIAGSLGVVVPSVWPEPFSLVGPEAMSQRKPVIAFDSGGIRDWLGDGQTGFLIPPRDTRTLGEKIRWLLDHPQEARTMGENGYRVFRERFSLEVHIRQLTAIYQKLCAS